MVTSPFAITAVTNKVELDRQNAGRGTYTVSNRSGQSVRGRAQVVAKEPEASWLSIEGAAERDFNPGFTHQYSVRIRAAAGTPTGTHTLRLDMTALIPALGIAEGPPIAFVVTTVVPVVVVRRGYVATLVGAAVGGLVAALVGAVPGALLALTQSSSISFDTVLTVVAIGELLAGVATVGGGAWVNLRAQGYDGAMQTGIILAAIYSGWAILVALVYAVIGHLSGGRVGGGFAVLAAVLIVLAPPVPARVLYFALQKAGRLP